MGIKDQSTGGLKKVLLAAANPNISDNVCSDTHGNAFITYMQYIYLRTYFGTISTVTIIHI